MQVWYEPEKEYVFGEISGPVRIQDAQKSIAWGNQVAKENNCHKFLIDMSAARVQYSIGEAILFIKEIKNFGFTWYSKIAFITNHDQKYHQLFKNIAFNQGWTNIRHFKTIVEAEEWLSGSS